MGFLLIPYMVMARAAGAPLLIYIHLSYAVFVLRHIYAFCTRSKVRRKHANIFVSIFCHEAALKT